MFWSEEIPTLKSDGLGEIFVFLIDLTKERKEK